LYGDRSGGHNCRAMLFKNETPIRGNTHSYVKRTVLSLFWYIDRSIHPFFTSLPQSATKVGHNGFSILFCDFFWNFGPNFKTNLNFLLVYCNLRTHICKELKIALLGVYEGRLERFSLSLHVLFCSPGFDEQLSLLIGGTLFRPARFDP